MQFFVVPSQLTAIRLATWTSVLILNGKKKIVLFTFHFQGFYFEKSNYLRNGLVVWANMTCICGYWYLVSVGLPEPCHSLYFCLTRRILWTLWNPLAHQWKKSPTQKIWDTLRVFNFPKNVAFEKTIQIHIPLKIDRLEDELFPFKINSPYLGDPKRSLGGFQPPRNPLG